MHRSAGGDSNEKWGCGGVRKKRGGGGEILENCSGENKGKEKGREDGGAQRSRRVQTIK